MIHVFCEYGGEVLLGKARGLADSVGDRVGAIVSSGGSTDPQKLIYLGADEVLRCDAGEPDHWIALLSSMISNEPSLKSLIFPSNLVCNVIMGAVYSKSSERVSIYCDDADLLEESFATKSLIGTDYALQKSSGDKVSLVSIKASSVAPPFEDSSRYGKVRQYEWKKEKAPSIFNIQSGTDSRRLTVLVGLDSSDSIKELSGKLGRKYDARVVKFSGGMEVVYGPCLAIEIYARARDLPKIDGYLIALNSKKAPIASVADAVVVSENIEKIIAQLVQT